MANQPSPEAMTIARWWADWLRDIKWLEDESNARRERAVRNFTAANLIEKRIRAFELHLAARIDDHRNRLPRIGVYMHNLGSCDAKINSAAENAQFKVTLSMFPRESYTNLGDDGHIVAGNAWMHGRVLKLIRSW
jgi:hypothetical protein